MAVIIGDAQDLGAMLDKTPRTLVRTSGGGIYFVSVDFVAAPSAVAVWYSADGGTWAEKDAGNRPAAVGGLGIEGVATAIDSNNLLHIFFLDLDLQFSYTTFDTTTDQWNGGNPANVVQVAVVDENPIYPARQSVAITIDSNDKPHVAYCDATTRHGTDYDTVYYSNKVGVGWKAPLEIEGITDIEQCHYVDITVNAGDIPLIVYINSSTFDVKAAKGNVNDAATFTLKEVDAGYYAPTIAVDSNGDAWIAYMGAGPSWAMTIAKQSANWTDAWTITDDGDEGDEPSIVAVGTDIYIFYEDDNDEIVYNKYDGVNWSGEIVLQAGAWRNVKARWAYLNNYPYASVGIDYVFGTMLDAHWDTHFPYIPKVIFVS